MHCGGAGSACSSFGENIPSTFVETNFDEMSDESEKERSNDAAGKT